MPLVFAALLWLGAIPAAFGAEALIRDRVEALQAGTPVRIEGETIAAPRFLSELYRRRGFRPTWFPTATEQLLESIQAIEEDGLKPTDYHLARIKALLARASDPEIQGPLDLLLTDALLRLAYHARFGKLDPEALDPNWNFTGPLVASDPVGTVQRVIDSGAIRQFIDSLKPEHPFYAKIKAALARYRAIAAQGGWPSVPAGPTLKPGMSDTRIPALRRRLAATGDLDAALGNDARDFDAPLEKAVRAFQERHGLKPDGAVGKATLAALNMPVTARIDQLRATLERCRWVMHDLPPQFVLVNIAGFKVYWVEHGEYTWDSPVVVGKPYTRTPIFRADMKFIVLNPTWTVPASIARNEILPAVRRDPGYLSSKHIRYVNGRYVQSPGDHNALGRIKLMFPNPHSVYLHDTPSKSLFAEASRSFSHGCVRVQKPFELAARVLDEPAVTERTLLEEMASGKSRKITLKRPVPVLILYWTASVDREGTVRFLSDIYNRDPEIVRGLNGPLVPLKRSRVIDPANGGTDALKAL